MKRLWYLLIFIFLFFGCYGLETTESCSVKTNPEEKMECYHQAAMVQAYGRDVAGARANCNEITNLGGEYEGTSEERKAELERNKCYYDIAEILATKGSTNAHELCAEIRERPGTAALFGSTVTASMCNEQVERLEKLNPEEYYSNDNNICNNVVFIIPLTAFLFFRLVHEL